MITDCPNCGTKIGKGVVKCPKCAELFFENALVEGPSAVKQIVPVAATRSPAAPSSSSQPSLESSARQAFVPEIPLPSSDYRETMPPPRATGYVPPSSSAESMISVTDAVTLIYKKLKSKIAFWNTLMVWSVLLSVIAVFLVTRSMMLMNEMVEKGIAERFSEEKVIHALNEVAKKEAKQSIQKNLDPSLKELERKIQETEKYLAASKAKFDKKYALLAKNSALIGEKRMILKLSEQSLRGYRKSYENLALQTQRKDSKALADFANQEKIRVENAFRLSTRLEGVRINYKDPSGKGWVDGSVPVDILIREMRESPSWKIRAKAAQLLGNHIEPRLPEILLEAAEMDPFLDVLKYALESFSKITGYDGNDIFNVEAARSWWKEHQPSEPAVSEANLSEKGDGL